MLLCDTWEDGDDELDIALEGLTQELIPYEKKFLNISRENDEIIERCKCIVLASQPKIVGNRTRNTGVGIPIAPSNSCFKPQPDLKPIFLARDCTLPEFITFGKTFIIYMNSAGTAVPSDAVFSHLRVHMDPWWYVELKHKGLDINTDLISFPKIMDIVSHENFPIHNR